MADVAGACIDERGGECGARIPQGERCEEDRGEPQNRTARQREGKKPAHTAILAVLSRRGGLQQIGSQRAARIRRVPAARAEAEFGPRGEPHHDAAIPSVGPRVER